MGFVEIDRWEIRCDGCDAYFNVEYRVRAMFETEQQARDALSYWDAKIIDDKIYCCQCVEDRTCKGCGKLFSKPVSPNEDDERFCEKCTK